jgi:hypothetical protein
MRMLLRPTSRYQQRDPPVMTTCTHARCRNVRKPGPVRYPRGRVRRPRWTPRSDRFRTTRARSHLAGHRPLHPARHPNRSDADRERTNGTAGIRTSPIATTMKIACRDAEPPPLGPALRLGNQDRLGDGNTASATVTTSVTRQLLGVALSPRLRLGALLSFEWFGWRVERSDSCHPLWRCLKSGRRWRSMEWRCTWSV